jgi:hypothetical protein
MLVEVCEVCGSTNIKEIKCKLVCLNCGTILRSCADLGAITPSIEVNPNGS